MVATEACGKGVDMLEEAVAMGSSTSDDVEAASLPILNVIGTLTDNFTIYLRFEIARIYDI